MRSSSPRRKSFSVNEKRLLQNSHLQKNYSGRTRFDSKFDKTMKTWHLVGVFGAGRVRFRRGGGGGIRVRVRVRVTALPFFFPFPFIALLFFFRILGTSSDVAAPCHPSLGVVRPYGLNHIHLL